MPHETPFMKPFYVIGSFKSMTNHILIGVFLSCSITLYSLCFISCKNSLVSFSVMSLFTSSIRSTTYFPLAFFYFSISSEVKHFLLWVRPPTSTWKTSVGNVP